MLLGSVPAARAQDAVDPAEFCRKAGRNQAIFEMLPGAATAGAGATPGAVTCNWSFARPGTPDGRADLTVTLESKLMTSEILALQTILMARLPENRRGRIVEPLPKMGDDGLSRATMENGVIRLLEIEAVRGRRHFLLTVRPRAGGDVSRHTAGAAINFLGVGISRL